MNKTRKDQTYPQKDSLRSVLKKELHEFYDNALESLFPNDKACMFCSKLGAPHAHFLCESCYKKLKPITGAQDLDLFNRELNQLSSIGATLTEPVMKKVMAAYAYDKFTARFIYDYKSGRQRALSYVFASMIGEHLERNFDMSKIDAIVPVPSSKDRLRMRGFDHVADISKKLAKRFDKRHIFLLKRLHHSDEQKNLDRQSRLQNIKGAFELNNLKTMPINVLLVDDIITTGATIMASALALREENIGIYVAAVFRGL